jgi:hypothetical protein
MTTKKQHKKDLTTNTLSDTIRWFALARPNPTSKQFHTQLGVHFEEVGEMIDEITPVAPQAAFLLHEAKVSLKALASYLKASDEAVTVEPHARTNFLDALCDQIVTATGVGQHCGFPMVEAMDEVNASNWSKFVDGLPIVDANGKIMKGPDHFKPDLSAYVPTRSPALSD